MPGRLRHKFNKNLDKIDYSSQKSKDEILAEDVKKDTVMRLTTLMLYHENKAAELNAELNRLLKENRDNVDY